MKVQLQYFAESIEENTQLGNEKTFTQDDVNRIVGKRLAEEKQKVEASLAEREKALKQKEFEFEAKQLLREKGFSEHFFNILKGDDIKTFGGSVEVLTEYVKAKVETHREGIDSGAGSGYYSSNDNNHIRNAMGLR